MTDVWRERLASALEVDSLDLIAEPRRLPHAHIEGRLFDDGSVDDISDERLIFQLDTTYFTHPEYRWIEVGDNGLYPWFQAGDLICLWQLGEDEIATHVGRICVAWFLNEKGEEDVTIGIIESSSGPRRATIRRIGLPPLLDLELSSISVLAMSVYEIGESETELVKAESA